MVKKLLRLAREVWAMWREGQFAYGRETYRVGREEFREALAGVANRGLTGLTSHNYLKKALMGAVEKTSQRREREFREREEQLMAGREIPPGPPLPKGGEMPDDPEWRAEAVRLGQAVRRARTPEEKAEAQRRFQEYMQGET
jgi:hypothetical protein